MSKVGKNIVNIKFIIDESGSMASKSSDVIGGFDAYLNELRDDGNKYFISVTKFNTSSRVIYSNRPLSEVGRLEYSPGGGTALLDAIGDTLTESLYHATKSGSHQICDECGTPVHVGNKEKNIVVIMTDGEENSSHRFTKSSIKSMIEDRQGRGNWTFLFLGADINAFSDAQQIGVYTSNSFRYDGRNTRAMYASAGRSSSVLGSSAFMAATNLGTTVSDTADISREIIAASLSGTPDAPAVEPVKKKIPRTKKPPVVSS